MVFRDIEKLIERIKKEVPITWDLRQPFLDAIESMMATTRWTSPEIRYIRFEKLSDILERYLGRPDDEWKQQVWKIFNGNIKL